MSILSIMGLALLGLSVTIVLRGLRPDLAVYTAMATALVLLLGCITPIASIVDMLQKLAQQTSFSLYFSVILKTIGIGILSQLTADVCRDAGASAIASKVEFAAKILILTLCIPILEVLLSCITDFLG